MGLRLFGTPGDVSLTSQDIVTAARATQSPALTWANAQSTILRRRAREYPSVSLLKRAHSRHAQPRVIKLGRQMNKNLCDAR